MNVAVCKGGVRAQDWANMVKASDTDFILAALRLVDINTRSLDLVHSQIFLFRIFSNANSLFWPTEHSLAN